MAVMYNGKKLIPVQTVRIEKEFIRGESGKFRRVIYPVTITGTLLAYKGSPDGDGQFWTGSDYPPDTEQSIRDDIDKRLALLRNKKGAINSLFCEKGKLFEIQPYDGSLPIKFVPRVKNIVFNEGPWHTRVDYVITMETDRIDFGTFTLCSGEESNENDVEETWQIEPSDEKGRLYKIIHNVSAQAFDEYDPSGTGTLLRPGWEVARDDKVLPNLGFDEDIRDESLATDLTAFIPYNYVKNESIDVTSGRYSINESWVLYDGGNYLEEYTVSTRTGLDGISTVTIDGSVTGFSTQTEPGFGDKYTNAAAGWSTIQPLLITRAQTYSNLVLNGIVQNKNVGYNPTNGVITYNYEYTNAKTSDIPGAINELVTITDDLPVPVIAKHICVLRDIGPVLQEISTITESRRTLTIDIQMSGATVSFTPSKPNVDSIISDNVPNATYEGPYVEKNTETWTERNGKYSKVITWMWV
jgi:hypothetical protein